MRPSASRGRRTTTSTRSERNGARHDPRPKASPRPKSKVPPKPKLKASPKRKFKASPKPKSKVSPKPKSKSSPKRTFRASPKRKSKVASQQQGGAHLNQAAGRHRDSTTKPYSGTTFSVARDQCSLDDYFELGCITGAWNQDKTLQDIEDTCRRIAVDIKKHNRVSIDHLDELYELATKMRINRRQVKLHGKKHEWWVSDTLQWVICKLWTGDAPKRVARATANAIYLSADAANALTESDRILVDASC